MTDTQRTEHILRRRMHGLYLSRPCPDLLELSRDLLGLHSWFYRNVFFSAHIRGAETWGWKTALTKTWLYRGTLHGVTADDLPTLLAVHPMDGYLSKYFGAQFLEDFSQEVLRYMEDGVFSRAEFRSIFAEKYDPRTIDALFSPWGGIFVYLARQGKVAFRDMASRDFDLISAEPSLTREEALPLVFERFLTAYGPATLKDAAWFLGLWAKEAAMLKKLPLARYASFEMDGQTYYDIENGGQGDIPPLTLLSGFDPLIVSYSNRSAVLPEAYRSRVILKSGICHPTIALNGRVAGIWNIKKNEPVVEFFDTQPESLVSVVRDQVATLARAAAL